MILKHCPDCKIVYYVDLQDDRSYCRVCGLSLEGLDLKSAIEHSQAIDKIFEEIRGLLHDFREVSKI